ncbi:hypothetical protein HZI73_10145 [Vallitalea pronyensis]|uniref:Periplasmic copper-binding protein NosD beta helix domain-containing protein n=1 Tax=Vallitalea pronyensis TaxID=1348613 RepID=A0A8J8MJK6_9FIRM|nr:NosD domain-containing protein [Vallitalea pronyensis]QUI22636.1 hypothetical protein HZI73_10145 [Vallitalea pronyensis]
MSTYYVSRAGLSIGEALDTCQPGDHILITDRYFDTEKDIVICKDHITLAGKTISTLVGIRAIGIRITGNQVTLKNLELKGFDDTGILIEGDKAIIEHCYICHNGGCGMLITGHESIIQHNSIYLNNTIRSSGFKIIKGTGICLEGKDHKINHNLCMFHYDYGIYSHYPLNQTRIAHNSIKCLNQHDWEYKKNCDIAIMDPRSSHNDIKANNLYSYTGVILAGPHNIIHQNRFAENKIGCMLAGSHNQVNHNVIMKADKVGIDVQKGMNHIIKNVISKSVESGIKIASDHNRIASNLLTGNTQAIHNEGHENVLENNAFYNNEQDVIIPHEDMQEGGSE